MYLHKFTITSLISFGLRSNYLEMFYNIDVRYM
jgi:hypothetical protein